LWDWLNCFGLGLAIVGLAGLLWPWLAITVLAGLLWPLLAIMALAELLWAWPGCCSLGWAVQAEFKSTILQPHASLNSLMRLIPTPFVLKNMNCVFYCGKP
jgi:hypothetical protein